MDVETQEKLSEAARKRVEGDYGGAKAVYEAVLAADGECAAALHGLGFVQMMGYGEFEEGLHLMEAAVARSPEDQVMLLDLAKSYAMLGDDDRVKPLLERVIALGADTKQGEEARNQLQYYS
jgi:Tetratricopeptide repeat